MWNTLIESTELVQKKKVVVMMSTYNGEEFLSEQLRSIYQQEDVEVEVLARDDGSSDLTIKVLEDWKDKISLSIIKGSNIGAAKSFLDLLKNVQLEEKTYYAFADQDDFWFPDKLKNAIAQLEKYINKPALYYTNSKYVGANLEEIENPYPNHQYSIDLRTAIIVGGAPGCTMVFNGKLLNVLKGYFPDKCYMHDLWVLNVCAAINGQIIYNPEPSMLYRQHERNVISSLGKGNGSVMELWGHRIKKLFDFSYKPSEMAECLLDGYANEINHDAKKFLQFLASSKTSFMKRIKIIVNPKGKSAYFSYNVRFAIQVLLNKQ